MGPFALFDKSFIQMLNVDEAILFDALFGGVICPIFYVEVLADLKLKATGEPFSTEGRWRRGEENAFDSLLSEPSPSSGLFVRVSRRFGHRPEGTSQDRAAWRDWSCFSLRLAWSRACLISAARSSPSTLSLSASLARRFSALRRSSCSSR
jgi:hypothetical protein